MSRKRKPINLPIGPILEGNLKEKELIDAMMEAVESIPLDKQERQLVSNCRAHMAGYYSMIDDDRAYWASVIITALEDVISNHLPPFCTFLMDGSRVGVWPDRQLIADAERETEVIRTGDAIDFREWREKGKDAPPFNLVVNDHGNMTLYQKRRAGRGWKWREVWSVV